MDWRKLREKKKDIKDTSKLWSIHLYDYWKELEINLQSSKKVIYIGQNEPFCYRTKKIITPEGEFDISLILTNNTI
jgi:hypothetical protein